MMDNIKPVDVDLDHRLRDFADYIFENYIPPEKVDLGDGLVRLVREPRSRYVGKEKLDLGDGHIYYMNMGRWDPMTVIVVDELVDKLIEMDDSPQIKLNQLYGLPIKDHRTNYDFVVVAGSHKVNMDIDLTVHPIYRIWPCVPTYWRWPLENFEDYFVGFGRTAGNRDINDKEGMLEEMKGHGLFLEDRHQVFLISDRKTQSVRCYSYHGSFIDNFVDRPFYTISSEEVKRFFPKFLPSAEPQLLLK